MLNTESRAGTGIIVPDVLLPAKNIDLFKWAVVACDQRTQERQFWEKTAEIAAGVPSTLNLVFPEVYLEDEGKDARIKKIHETMRSYLAGGVFAPAERGFVYIERETTGGLRQGLIAAADLECYDWRPEARLLIRASEGTIEARLPPRMDIRRIAPLELPHIMLLIDDEADALFKGLAAGTGAFAYDTDLMQGGGRVRGRFVRNPTVVADTLVSLAESSLERYGNPEPFLFTVGDGNHSLATAKAVWDEYKAGHRGEPGLMESPLRYALVEIVNIYNAALRFEPIHRVLFGPATNMQNTAGTPCAVNTIDIVSVTAPFQTRSLTSRAELSALVRKKGKHTRFGVIQGDHYILVEASSPLLVTAILDPVLEKFRAAHPAMTLDYIHGENELFTFCEKDNAVGFLLPPFEKKGLFDTVAKTGPLPRKSFSMGEAQDKRYYLEARQIHENH
jgi:hypothetical protein